MISSKEMKSCLLIICLNTFSSNNEHLSKCACKDDNCKEITLGANDQNNYSVYKAPENDLINLEDSRTSKDLSDICNRKS